MAKTSSKDLKTRPDLDDRHWLVWTAAQPENKGIDVHAMYRKMLTWCRQKGVTPTRLRLLRWLDTERQAVPLTYEPPNMETGDEICTKCSGTAHITVNDFSSPCPKCRPTEEKAFWKARGR